MHSCAGIGSTPPGVYDRAATASIQNDSYLPVQVIESADARCPHESSGDTFGLARPSVCPKDVPIAPC